MGCSAFSKVEYHTAKKLHHDHEAAFNVEPAVDNNSRRYRHVFDDQVGMTAEEERELDESEANKPKQKPQIFAFIRTAHEIIRGGLRDLREAIVVYKDLERASSIWRDLYRFMKLHHDMEEGKQGKCKGLFQYVLL